MAINLSGLYNQSNSFLPGYTSSRGHIPGSNTVFDLLNTSKQRLDNTGLGLGGILGRAKSIPNIVISFNRYHLNHGSLRSRL